MVRSFRWIPRGARVNVFTVLARVALCVVCLSAVSGCVIGRSTRPSGNESAQGPLAAPVTGSPLLPQTAAESGDAPPAKAKPGATWMQGYWHWDGVRYVWQRGHFQADAVPAPAAAIH